MFSLTRKINRIVCFCLLFSLSFPLLGASKRVEAAQSDAPVQVSGIVQTGKADLQVEGRLVPKRFANLAMSSSGIVEGVLVQEGDWVDSGQLLMRQGGGDHLLAEIADAEMELLMARQGLQALYTNAELVRALAERELAQARKESDKAEYHLGKLKETAPQLSIDQAYANMVLAGNAVDRARDVLARTEKQLGNRNNPILQFISRRQVKLLLTSLERNITIAQKRYENSIRKYQDLLAPVDEIELATAEADLAYAQARLTDAQHKYTTLVDGPEPEEVAAAQMRVTVAEANLSAVKKGMQELELLAPFAGTVVDVSVKSGEWVELGQPVMVLAVMSEWIVETTDLTEIQVPEIRLGQGVKVIPEALPDLTLTGKVESISEISTINKGDVTYTARITLIETEPRLRWGMTVAVIFDD